MMQVRRATGVAALVLLAAGVIALFSCGRGQAPGDLELFIISPHGSDIRTEFEQGFVGWYEHKFGIKPRVSWIDIGAGGSGNIQKVLESQRAGGGSGAGTYDIAWGGGSGMFNRYAREGFLARPEDAGISAEAARDYRAAVERVPKDIFGTPMHEPGGLWIAATMSNFCIIYNKDRLAELGLPAPRRWADICGPGWLGNLSLADPSKSGSVRSSYDMVFAEHGWEKGWELMTLMFANTENLRDSGSAPADDVGSAQAVAAVAIDFYARKQVIRIGEKLIEVVVPEGGSTIDPDPIAMLKGAPHPELAARFIEYVISPEGQRLWVHRPGLPPAQGGPRHYALGRLSVLPKLYEEEGALMTSAENPFASKEPLKLDVAASAARNAFIGDLIKTALMDNHDLLVETRAVLKGAGDPPELLKRLTAVPTYVPISGFDGNGEPQYQPQQAITGDQLQRVAGQFNPPKTDPRAKFTELMQTQLRDHWRDEYEKRLRGILSDVRSRK